MTQLEAILNQTRSASRFPRFFIFVLGFIGVL
jgi:hypothetical protein